MNQLNVLKMKQRFLDFLSDLIKYRYSILLILIANFVCYSYLFTEHIFTNHTVPEIYRTIFPSFVTNNYGRWMSDIITTIGGGVGVQPVGMLISTFVIIINAFLITKIFGLNDPKWFVFTGLILTLAPERFDIITFSSVVCVHAFADFFVLIGIYQVVYNRSFLKRIIIPIVMFIFALACTQIKLPFILLMLECSLLLKWIILNEDEKIKNKKIINDIIVVFVIAILSIGLYYLTFKLIIILITCQRLSYQNNLQEILFQFINSYKDFWEYFTLKSSYLPNFLQALPFVIISIALGCLISWLYKREWLMILFSVVIVLSIPIVMNTIYILNTHSGSGGRFVMHYSYFLVICILIIVKKTSLLSNQRRIWPQRIIILFSIILIYFSSIFSLQRTNYFFHKGKQEELLVQRVLSRVELKIPDLYSNTYSLIVIGHPKIITPGWFFPKNIEKAPFAHFSTNLFEIYRQPEIFNYFLGTQTFHFASKSDFNLVLPLIKSSDVWPSETSIIVQNNIVVIIFEKYHEGIATTWSVGN